MRTIHRHMRLLAFNRLVNHYNNINNTSGNHEMGLMRNWTTSSGPALVSCGLKFGLSPVENYLYELAMRAAI